MPYHLKRLTLIIFLMLALAQCQAPKQAGHSNKLFAEPHTLQPLPKHADEQVYQLHNADTEHKHDYRIRLARHLIKNNRPNIAAKITKVSNDDQAVTTQLQEQLLSAHIHLLNSRYQSASLLLDAAYQNPDNQSILSNEAYYHLLQAYAKKNQQLYKKYNFHMHRAIHLAEQEPALHKTISTLYWHELNENIEHLQPILSNDIDSNAQGWLALATILQHKNPDLFQNPNNIITQIQQWQEQYPNHAAQSLLKNTKDLQQPPERIAILLPKAKNTKNVSAAIENGILASYYATNTHNTQLKMINTSEDISSSVQQAINFNADANIGPVLKEEVDSLNQLEQLNIPTLALNSIDENQHPQTLHSYSIATAYEAKQLAKSILQQGYRKTIIIYDNSSYHTKTLEHFSKHFTNNGGSIVATTAATGNINAKISNILGIGTSQSHYSQLTKISNEKIRFSPERRTDFDNIVIIASSEKARQINPMLHYHFADDVPIFGFSSIINPIADSKKDKDLNGIIFFDSGSITKKKLSFGQKIQKSIQQFNPKEFARNSRYNALGIDAYLITKLSYLWQIMPSYVIAGAGATIYLDSHQNIKRQLEPMTYQRGRLKAAKVGNNNQRQWNELLNLAL